MSTSALAQRSQEKLMERIKALRKLKENRKCFECLSKSPSCVDTTHNTFVCMTCGGILRMFNFRVKSISISSFAVNEVEALESGGNKAARKKWLAGFDAEHPASGNTEQIKEFIRKKYEENAWINKSGKPKRRSNTEQYQSEDEDSETAPSITERKTLGSSKLQARISTTARSAPPDLLDLSAIFSSQPAPEYPPANFNSSFSHQSGSYDAHSFAMPGSSDWGSVNQHGFRGSFKQTPQIQTKQQPLSNFGQSFQSLSGPSPPDNGQQYPMAAMQPQGFNNSNHSFGMMELQPAQMPHFPNMSMIGQNIFAQQNQQQPHQLQQHQQQPHQLQQHQQQPHQLQQHQQQPHQLQQHQQQLGMGVSPNLAFQQLSFANTYPISQPQPQQQSQSFAPLPQTNTDPFAGLLAPGVMALTTASQPAKRNSLPSEDLLAYSNATSRFPAPEMPLPYTVGTDPGNSGMGLVSIKRSSIPSDNTAMLSFGNPDASDSSNPFGPVSSTSMAASSNDHSSSFIFGVDQQMNRAAPANFPPSSMPSPFYYQPTTPFNQQSMQNLQRQQQYSHVTPMQEQQMSGQMQPQFPGPTLSGQIQGMQSFASRPVEPFPLNNMISQSNVSAYGVPQTPFNETAPDFFSKRRPAESLDSDLNSNPFL